MKAIQRVLDAVAQGYSTSPEIADFTGIPKNSVRAHLSVLTRAGLIERSGYLPAEHPGVPTSIYVAKEAN